MNQSLFETARAGIADTDALFLRTPEGRRITYGALFEQSGRMAAALVSLGVEPGARVAVQVDKSPDAIVLYLAVLRAGAVFLPLNPDYTLAELEYYVADAQPVLVICRPSMLEATRALAVRLGVPTVESLGTEGDGTLMDIVAHAVQPFADVARTAGDLAAILYTSGTTGRAKGAMLTHGNLVSNAKALADAWRWTAADVLIHALPIFHAHGLFVAINVTLFAGAAMVFLPRFDTAAILAAMPTATALMGVPTFYVRLLGEPRFDARIAGPMRLFISGSAPLLGETHAAFQARTGHAILERYGMTETGMITSNPYEGERRGGTVGFPLADVSVRVAEPDTGALLGCDEIGVLEVSGPNVFVGYWAQPEKTAAEFRPDGYFVTGDLGKIDARGYVHIVGRAKDLIISGGFNVYPKEVESEIDALDGVLESAVIGLPHVDFGEAVTAVVVLRGPMSDGAAAIVAALEHRLAKYKLPKKILFIDELPRNTMGKVQKEALRQKYKLIY